MNFALNFPIFDSFTDSSENPDVMITKDAAELG